MFVDTVTKAPRDGFELEPSGKVKENGESGGDGKKIDRRVQDGNG